MSLENVVCPLCGSDAVYDTRKGTHVCLNIKNCEWQNVEPCEYFKCKNTSLYPSKLCYQHKTQAEFITWVYGDVLKGTIDNVKALEKLISGE